MRRRRARSEKGEAAATPSSSFAVGSSPGEKDTNDDACPPLPPPTGPPAASSRKSPTHLALLGILYSLLLRTLSFILNIITKRFVSPDTLGKSDVTLDLLLSTTLFLAREGFRLGLGRGGGDGRNGDDPTGAVTTESKTKEMESSASDREQRLANTAYLSIVSGFVASAVALGTHLHHCYHAQTTDGRSTGAAGILGTDYLCGGILYTTAALLEMLSEPYQIFCLRSLDVDTRAAADGAGNLGRAIINVLLLGGLVDRILGTGLALHYPVSCFGAGHIVHAMLLGGVLRWRKRGQIRGPRFVANPANRGSALSVNLDLASLRLVGIFSAQSVFKHLLTEGDRIVLTLLGSSYERGVYGMASSIGGIASRMLLQPVEENARLLFGRLGYEVVTGAATATDAVSEEEGPEHAAWIPTHNTELETLERTYTTLIKMVLYFGLLFASLGSNYTSILLRILAGNSWGSNEDATAALSAFCIYTALLALNGTTEAFVYGVASTYRDVGMLSTVHAMVTVIAFGFVAPMLIGRYGTVGLVGANCLAMALRSIYSISFAAAYFCSQNVAGEENNNAKVERKYPAAAAAVQVFIKMVSLLRKMLPRGIVLFLFIATHRITDRTRAHLLAFEKDAMMENDGQSIRITSKSWLLSAGKHVGVGIICATAIALVAYKLEDEARRDARTMMMSTRKTSTKTRSRPRKKVD